MYTIILTMGNMLFCYRENDTSNGWIDGQVSLHMENRKVLACVVLMCIVVISVYIISTDQRPQISVTLRNSTEWVRIFTENNALLQVKVQKESFETISQQFWSIFEKWLSHRVITLINFVPQKLRYSTCFNRGNSNSEILYRGVCDADTFNDQT